MAAEKSERCVIICASPEADVEFLARFVRGDDFIVCADGGLSYVLAAGAEPDLIVGDFDSYDGVLPESVETVTLNRRKDFSDTHIAADIALERGYRDIVLMFATGGRLDHTLSNICVLKYLSGRGASACAVSARERVYYCSDSLEIGGCEGKTFSLIAYNCDNCTATCAGDIEYPVSDTVFSSGVSLGLSNVSRGDRLSLRVSDGEMLLIIND